jgi:hypothetical protein
LTKVGSQEKSNYFNFLVYSSDIDFIRSLFIKIPNIAIANMAVAATMPTVINYLDQFQPAKNQPKNSIEYINETVIK